MVSCLRLTLIVVLIAILAPLIWRYSDRREFNYNTTADQAANNVDLNDKVVIVTGSNTGIGLPTAKVLLSRGATVIMACRDMQKADKAKQQIVRQIIDSNSSVMLPENGEKTANMEALENKLEIINLDLGSFESIDLFVNSFLTKYDKLNYLILNAGLQKPEWVATSNGIEQTFGVNHVGNYYLAQQLTPILIKTAKNGPISRVISVASAAHSFSPKPITDWLKNENLIQNKDQFSTFATYAFSKLCNILFAREYNERYSKENVYAVSLHPGVIITEIGRELNPIRRKFIYLGKALLKTVDQGAATTLRTVSLTDDQFKKYGGSYFSHCNVANDDLRADLFPEGEEKDKMPQTMLWKLTDEMINKYK